MMKIPQVREDPPVSAPTAEIVELACRAPSVCNTQPWLWRIDDGQIELRADRSRQLPVADPEGRNLTMSCGTALHHVQVVAHAFGYRTLVIRLPNPRDPDHLATVHLSPGATAPTAAAELRALRRRTTDGRRFTSWPVPGERLAGLAAAVPEGGEVQVVPLTDASVRFRVESLITRALAKQDADARYAAERRAWLEDDDPAEGSGLASSDGLLALCTAGDGPLAWLRAGEALSALWLRATEEGLSVVPLSQVVEVPETRAALCHTVFLAITTPQVLVRIGWLGLGRSEQPRPPRRPLDSVLLR